MNPEELFGLIKDEELYNLHSHTQFCDGRASMAEIAGAARAQGFRIWGFSPHSPLNIPSPCNMDASRMEEYLDESRRISELYTDMRTLTSLEIDYMGADWGPHLDYFQKLPLDYRIGSVHFVPNQDGVMLDCDGSFQRFGSYLKDGYRGDLRYVVEKYFEQVLMMMERGGFDILGHFDKIAGNASMVDPELETYGWYKALIDDVISHASASDILVEINTKSIFDKNRFFPARIWWRKLLNSKIRLVVNSDTHYPEKVNIGRPEALKILHELTVD